MSGVIDFSKGTRGKVDRPTLVIYHANCADGFGSAWCAHKKYPNAVFVAAQHGDEPPYNEAYDKDVYIIDFSYDRDSLFSLNKVAKSLLVLDHHKSAEKALEGLPFCTFDMNRSGAMMAWDHFFPGEKSPWFIDYIQDRDIWTWELKDSEAINVGLDLVDRTFEAYDGIYCEEPTYALYETLKSGKAALAYQKKLVERICTNAREVEFHGHKVLAVNAAVLQSEVGHELAEDRPFAIVWRQVENGDYIYSFRVSDESDFDVSELAASYGGGGHKKAAGCSSNRPLL